MPKTKTVSTEESLWNTKQVAEFLGLAPRTVHKLRYSGRLPYVRFSHTAVKFVPADVRKFASGHRISGEAA